MHQLWKFRKTNIRFKRKIKKYRPYLQKVKRRIEQG